MSNFKQINLKEVQKIFLKYFLILEKILKENNIVYYCLGGTALGAVRHKGFIPWDDDIDIGLMRDDYEKLLKIITTYKSDLIEFEHFTNTKFLDHALIRVHFIKTHRFANYNGKFKDSLFIDIFPLDNVPNRVSLQKKQMKKIRKYKYLLQIKAKQSASSFSKKIILKCFQILLSPFSYRFLAKKIDDVAKKHPYSGKCCSMMSQYSYAKQTFDISIYGSPVKMQFEDIIVCVPERVDEYLFQLFGKDYMQPSKRSGASENALFYLE